MNCLKKTDIAASSSPCSLVSIQKNVEQQHSSQHHSQKVGAQEHSSQKGAVSHAYCMHGRHSEMIFAADQSMMTARNLTQRLANQLVSQRGPQHCSVTQIALQKSEVAQTFPSGQLERTGGLDGMCERAGGGGRRKDAYGGRCRRSEPVKEKGCIGRVSCS